MKQVKILTYSNGSDLEERINNFIEFHTVTDIQYQVSGRPDNYGAPMVYSAMIIYEEETNV